MMSIVNLISDRLNSSIENEGSASLVLSGGSSPISIYEELSNICLLYTSPSPRDMRRSRMPSSA